MDRSMVRQKITIQGLIHVPNRPNPQVLLCQSLIAGEPRYSQDSSIVETLLCKSGMLFMPDIPMLDYGNGLRIRQPSFFHRT